MSSLIREDLALYGFQKLDLHFTHSGRGRSAPYMGPYGPELSPLSEGTMSDDGESTSTRVPSDTEIDENGGSETGTEPANHPSARGDKLGEGEELLQENGDAGGRAVGTRLGYARPTKRPRFTLPGHPVGEERARGGAGVPRDVREILQGAPAATEDNTTGRTEAEASRTLLGGDRIGENTHGARPCGE